MMNQWTKGAIVTLGYAALFGITPILGTYSYAGGSNGVMLPFLRSAMAVPLLFLLLKIRRIPVGISRRNLRDVIILGTFGSAASGAMYNMSYQYITVGLATVLNCTYPFFVVIISVLVFRERAGRVTILSLLMAMAGVFLFSDVSGGGQVLGVVLAVLSAVAFAFVMLYQYRSSLSELSPLQMSFWTSVVVAVALFFFGLFSGRFTLALTPSAWFYTFLVAVVAAVIGLPMLQYGIKRVGASTASVLTMLEPITSVVAGILFLGESITLLKVLGGLLVLAGVLLLTLGSSRRHVTESPEPVTGDDSVEAEV